MNDGLTGSAENRGARALPVTLLLIGIISAGAYLRLHNLDRTSLWNDEAWSWAIVDQSFRDMMHAWSKDTNPPLYYIILHIATWLLGTSENALRLPSALIGIANIYVIYRLGAVLWDRLAGVFAAALLAFSGFHLWYSQEARTYALLCLTATMFAWASVRFCNKPDRWTTALCGLAGLALLYSHIYGSLNWIGIDLAVGVTLLTGRDRPVAVARRWLAVQGLVLIGFVPWVIMVMPQVRSVQHSFWVPFPTIHFLAAMAKAIVGGTPMLASLAVLVLVTLRSSARGPIGWPRLLLLSWGVLPLLAGYLLSVVGQPILFDRYLIGSLPPLLLLAARGLCLLRFSRVVLGGAIAILIACDIAPVRISVGSAEREDFR